MRWMAKANIESLLQLRIVFAQKDLNAEKRLFQEEMDETLKEKRRGIKILRFCRF